MEEVDGQIRTLDMSILTVEALVPTRLEVVVGSTERVHPTVAALTSTTAEVFTVEPTTTATDTAMAVVITDTLALESSTTTTGALAVSLAAAKGPLPWEQVPDFWAVPWQVWLRCRCIIGIECTKACCFTVGTEGTMGTGTDTVPMGTATEECWSMNTIAWVVVQCKLFVTTVSADAAQVMTQGMVNVGKTSMPSTTTTGTIGKARALIPTNPAVVMRIAKTLT